MTTLREAAAQALGALTKVHPGNMSWETGVAWMDTVQILRAALAQPEPKPVADTDADVLTATYMLGLHAGKKAAQRQWQELTNGEIHTAYITATNQTLRPQDERLAFAFARAIEQAHGIGDKE